MEDAMPADFESILCVAPKIVAAQFVLCAGGKPERGQWPTLPQNDPTEHQHSPVTELTPENLLNKLNLVQVCFTHNLICKRALPAWQQLQVSTPTCFAADLRDSRTRSSFVAGIRLVFSTIDTLSIGDLWYPSMGRRSELLPGTLDMLILKTLTRGSMHCGRISSIQENCHELDDSHASETTSSRRP
jgi:hypothetical protein